MTRFPTHSAASGRLASPCEGDPGKRLVDGVGAALVAAVMAFPMLAIYLLVVCALGRPAIFRQERVGRGQQRFVMLKFRSMTEARGAAGQLLPDKQRLTNTGRFLRRFRLDELPELLNVLRGDMSIVGPRPLPPGELAGKGWLTAERARVRPGLTGWAQVNGNILLSSEEKLALDLWYVHHRSLWLDVMVLIKTADVVIRGDRRKQNTIRSAQVYAQCLGRSRNVDASCS